MTQAPQIIALGGGGFSMEPDNPLLDDFILSRARRPRPRVCFLPSASGDSASYLVRFYRAFAQRECIATDLTLFATGALPRHPASTSSLEQFVLEQDVVYVGGGNTANMLALWRVHGLDRLLRAAWENGTVLCGLSAGMICWFTCSVTDSYGPLAPLHDGLGLLPFSACPHYDGEAERRPCYQALVAGGFMAGYAADDGAALCFTGTALTEVVTSRPTAAAYRVALRDGAVVEERLSSRYLGRS
jgi:dipeptidase E